LGRAPEKVLARQISCFVGHAFQAGNGERLELDFDGIVAGCDIGEKEKIAKKQRNY
jgi:hypothetical protein